VRDRGCIGKTLGMVDLLGNCSLEQGHVTQSGKGRRRMEEGRVEVPKIVGDHRKIICDSPKKGKEGGV